MHSKSNIYPPPPLPPSWLMLFATLDLEVEVNWCRLIASLKQGPCSPLSEIQMRYDLRLRWDCMTWRAEVCWGRGREGGEWLSSISQGWTVSLLWDFVISFITHSSHQYQHLRKIHRSDLSGDITEIHDGMGWVLQNDIPYLWLSRFQSYWVRLVVIHRNSRVLWV